MSKHINKYSYIIIVLFMIVSPTVYAKDNYDSKAIEIIIVDWPEKDNTWLSFYSFNSDVSPYMINKEPMIPLRSLAEILKYNVEYLGIEKKITICDSLKKNKLVFSLESNEVYKNDILYKMEQVPIIQNGRTYISIKYVSEFFNKYVTWRMNIDNNTLFIWVSSARLLTLDDINVENDGNFYFSQAMEDQGLGTHILKSKGQTFRGIKHGDSYDKVFMLYGEPHKKTYRNGELYELSYEAERSLHESSRLTLDFYLDKGVVVDVRK